MQINSVIILKSTFYSDIVIQFLPPPKTDGNNRAFYLVKRIINQLLNYSILQKSAGSGKLNGTARSLMAGPGLFMAVLACTGFHLRHFFAVYFSIGRLPLLFRKLHRACVTVVAINLLTIFGHVFVLSHYAHVGKTGCRNYKHQYE